MSITSIMETDKENDNNKLNETIDKTEGHIATTLHEIQAINNSNSENVESPFENLVGQADNIIFTNMNNSTESVQQSNEIVDKCSTGNEKCDNYQPDTSSSSNLKKDIIQLFTEVEGPTFYNVTGNIVTNPVISKNLPKIFESLPVTGKPSSNEDVGEFLDAKLKAFVGPDIVDEEYEELSKYCR